MKLNQPLCGKCPEGQTDLKLVCASSFGDNYRVALACPRCASYWFADIRKLAAEEMRQDLDDTFRWAVFNVMPIEMPSRQLH